MLREDVWNFQRRDVEGAAFEGKLIEKAAAKAGQARQRPVASFPAVLRAFADQRFAVEDSVLEQGERRCPADAGRHADDGHEWWQLGDAG